MTQTPVVTFFDNNTDLVSRFALEIIQHLKSALSENNKASLVVSGGSTPKSLFQLLSQQELDWKYVTITLADERCLPQDHKDSNARLLRENLLINHAAAAHFVPLYIDNEPPEQAAKHASEKLGILGTHTVVILGMGTDGHTASLFPEASNLKNALASNAPACLSIDPITNNMMRVTQSKSRLLDAKIIYFHLVGENKIDTLNKVMSDSDKTLYPSSHFIHQHSIPVNVYFAKTK